MAEHEQDQDRTMKGQLESTSTRDATVRAAVGVYLAAWDAKDAADCAEGPPEALLAEQQRRGREKARALHALRVAYASPPDPALAAQWLGEVADLRAALGLPTQATARDATVRESRRIFVFGSNLAGVHGAGSAKAAAKHHGAQRGVGSGPTGNAYAIPTKSTWRHPAMPLGRIGQYVARFIEYAEDHPGLTFDVVRIGCGLAGYEDADIAPMFAGAPENVCLPFGWRELAASTSPTTEPA